MHHRRKHERGKYTRCVSSDWRYIQTEHGVDGRSHPSARRWIEKANQSFKDWTSKLNGPLT